MRILGIDPGSRKTGYGVIDTADGHISYVASGCISMVDQDLPNRLKTIFEGMQALIATYEPREMAIEKVFMHRNADSALKLGQARGAAICAVVIQTIPVHEYSATQIKQSVVGSGHAQKNQIQHMMKVLLELNDIPQSDAADALATAYCHANTSSTLSKLGGIITRRHGRYR